MSFLHPLRVRSSSVVSELSSSRISIIGRRDSDAPKYCVVRREA